MKPERKAISSNALNAILDYLAAEVDDAKTTADLSDVLSMAKALLLKAPTQNAVVGLGGIRADMDAFAMAEAQGKEACTVQLQVPTVLSGAFEDLSVRMSNLQDRDPETFTNASNAMQWLANGKLGST